MNHVWMIFIKYIKGYSLNQRPGLMKTISTLRQNQNQNQIPEYARTKKQHTNENRRKQEKRKEDSLVYKAKSSFCLEFFVKYSRLCH